MVAGSNTIHSRWLPACSPSLARRRPRLSISAGGDVKVDAIVTGPVEKHALHAAGFPFPGQTEWLGALAGGVEVAMMLASTSRPASPRSPIR